MKGLPQKGSPFWRYPFWHTLVNLALYLFIILIQEHHASGWILTLLDF